MFKKVKDFLNCRKALARFKALPRQQRTVVFYSEGPGYWSHFQPVFDALQKNYSQPVLYVTSSLHDPIYTNPPAGLKPFYIGSGLVRTWFFATLDVDVLLMSMPDLHSFHIKRSPHIVSYVYLHHSIVSTHMVYRPAAFDHFDAVLCVGPHHVKEIRQREKLHSLPAKTLVEHGYGRLDAMLQTVQQSDGSVCVDPTQVLIAPSWGDSSLLNLCGLQAIESLLDAGFKVVLRPHPRTRQLHAPVLEQIVARFGEHPQFKLDNNMDAYLSLQRSALMVSDWSGAALEFAFAYQRPIVFVNVPRKIQNEAYTQLELEPIEVRIRQDIGQVIQQQDIGLIGKIAQELMRNSEKWQNNISYVRKKTVFNLNSSGKIAADYVMSSIKK